ncbi:hypothetical protein GWK08_17550 [Leptobacterium flavescens]|uniref:Uncharacterized protein n=1 Tax=Leptobacterium flavescens TaxID=472055 RepID=A0A6P0UXS8_9FLAO|nr:hypothetical protein [Leptobacterium flavescens]NER15266.1 hypothetical protein [Leptobacterium flavescens]
MKKKELKKLALKKEAISRLDKIKAGIDGDMSLNIECQSDLQACPTDRTCATNCFVTCFLTCTPCP